MLQKIKTLTTAAPIPKGLLVDVPDSRDFVRSKAGNSPRKFSLRPHGRTTALDQKQTGACTGYSSAAFMSCLHGSYLAGAQWEASPMFIYYKSRLLYGNTNVDGGAPLRDTMKALHQFGVCPMSEHPDLYDWKKVPSAAADHLASLLKVKDYQRILVDPKAPDVMQTTLFSEQLPILIGVSLFSSSSSAAVKFSGNLPLPTSSDIGIGSHAMMIDSYDQDKQLFYGWNSWGAGWGSGGRFSLPFEYFTRADLCQSIWTVSYRYW